MRKEPSYLTVTFGRSVALSKYSQGVALSKYNPPRASNKRSEQPQNTGYKATNMEQEEYE